MSNIPDIPESLTHQDNAQAVLLDLRRLVGGVRGLTLLTEAGRRKLTIAGHVDDQFLRSIAVLLDNNPQLADSSEITGAEIRDHLNFSGSYQGVGEDLILNGQKVADTRLVERASVGRRALRVLKIARSASEPAERAALVPEMQAIDRLYSRGRRRRPATAKKEEPAPAPALAPRSGPEVKS